MGDLMPRYNPQERQSLMDLLAALQGGLAPDVASSFLGQIMQDQQERVTARRDNMQSLTQLMLGQAQAGASPKSTRITADILTPQPGLPNQLQGVMDQLYPREPANFAPIDTAGGRGGGYPVGQAAVQPRAQMSPVTSPDILSGMQEGAAAAQDEQDWGTLSSAAGAWAQRGQTPQAFIQAISADPDAARLIGSDPNRLRTIIGLAWTGGISSTEQAMMAAQQQAG